MIDDLNEMPNSIKNIVVVGQGAIGLLWYHHLSLQAEKHQVSLLASNQHSLSTKELSSANYHFTPYQQKAATPYPLNYCQDKDLQQAQLVILCLKSYQIAKALKTLAHSINKDCIVILAHNGMGTIEEAANVLPEKQTIIAMLTTHGCLRTGSLTIVHTGIGQSDIGLLSGHLSKGRQEQLTNLLNQALPDVSFHKNIVEKQWLKLAINCVINPITAINDMGNGDINQQQFSAQITQLLSEICQVANAVGVELQLEYLHGLVTKVAKATAKNCSSMRCDILADKPTEIDYINGYIHRLGQQYGIATPQNTKLWQQVLTMSATKKK